MVSSSSSSAISTVFNATSSNSSFESMVRMLGYGVASLLVASYLWYSNRQNNNNGNNNGKQPTTVPKEYFKLPKSVNIHVLNDVDEADKLLYDLYNSILTALGLPLVNIDEAIISNTSDESSTTSSTSSTTANTTNNNSSSSTSSTSSPAIKRLDETGLSIEATDKVVLGLDAEWAHDHLPSGAGSSQKSPRVALIQISTATDAYLLQMTQMSRIPKSLIAILTDPRILKVGVAINQDATTIFKNFNILTKGCVDLVPLARLTNYAGNGLASLAYSTLNGCNLDKNHLVRCSHWELATLSAEQIHYAACDAWISLAIYTQMLQTYRRNRALSCPDEPTPSSMDFCRSFINANFKIRDSKSGDSSDKNSSGNGHSKSAGKNNQKGMSKSSMNFGRDDRVLYDNCPLYGPDGTLLCNVSKKKVQWYLERNLGVITCENPLSIKLTFTPKGNGHADDAYYLSHKENRCVVCGTTKKILRHSIVPHSYRQYLPVEIKSHSSHDVVILCSECHFTMNKRLHFMKLVIADQYNVPFENTSSVIIDKDLLRMSKHAIVLFGHYFKETSKLKVEIQNEEEEEEEKEKENGNDDENQGNESDEKENEGKRSSSSNSCKSKCNSNKNGVKRLLAKKKPNIPLEKIEHMRKEVLTYLGKEELVEEDVVRLVQSNPKHKDDSYVAHEKQVMDKVLADGDEGIKKFIRAWRRNFVETVQPKFLNEHWCIDK
ncbi:3'-5' exonuclease domain-containing protein [Heterostelium album PN500]|uniref:3'-5' exonuclease domain-containing protein n=1 Tax=Heterostelium pallidum (strain ATCC 26659 / Pp 5 / PN500) TaxID=670386 RepID=D3BJ01_HETP5|nr:3'-5' exonuclease domain-containing protein [Heterostelium album PN500]EFA78775.1 3'-5' exonuclease domain-containing protein [Heterostelium album PN500]|eukprot:XP_020430899.1 3'-5' exonuclease domain-containing protein [Heterostelium album PN500]